MVSKMASASNALSGLSAELKTRPMTDFILAALWMFLTVATGFAIFGYGRDYYEYLIYYESIQSSFSFIDTRFEPLFHIFSWFSRTKLHIDLLTFVSILAAISLAIKFMIFRRYLAHPIFAAVLYTVLFFPIHEYTQYRVGIALSFGFWAVHCIFDRRYIWAIMLFSGAFFLHYSSILLLPIAVSSLYFRSRIAIITLILVLSLIVSINSLNYAFEDFINSLNPLSVAYLQNKTSIESVSILSINNILFAATLACFSFNKYFFRSEYHALMLTIAISSLVPIIMLPDSPVIAQRSKEILFPAIIFLSCRSSWKFADLPALILLVMTAALLGYLWVAGGIITL